MPLTWERVHLTLVPRSFDFSENVVSYRIGSWKRVDGPVVRSCAL